MTNSTVIIGTRGSELALWQANEASRLINAETEIRIIKTSGDVFQDIELQGQTEQGFFTKEIERLLLTGEIDIAVHSLKDLPTQTVDGLTIGAVLPRALENDLLIIHPDWHDENYLFPVKAGCKVGAMSLRRQALLKTYGPQAKAEAIRGNVPGRIERCVNGTFGAIILAAAGVNRLGLEAEGCFIYELNTKYWIPAPGQGAIAIEARANDARVFDLLTGINDRPTSLAVELERKVLSNFEGGCHTAFGALAYEIDDDEWILSIGIEIDGRWGVSHELGGWNDLCKLGPHCRLEFSAMKATEREDLCELIQL